MHLLLCTTPDQASYIKRFSTLSVLRGHRVSYLSNTPQTLSELHLKCHKAGVEGIICANEEILEKILEATPDFNRPKNKNGSDKNLTLDDYQGSFLELKSHAVLAMAGKALPVVVINPPEHIMTTTYGAYVFDRFIAKLTRPDDWFPQTDFVWRVASEATIEADYKLFCGARIIGIDIETPLDNPNRTINCISFTGYFAATHTTLSIVIPFTSMYWLAWIRKFCSIPSVPKVLQGGTYDVVYLLRFNCPVICWLYDTLVVFHSYYSELPKRLDFITAFAIRKIRYWKDDGKTGNLEDYYRYNAMDGWATVNALLSLVLEHPAWAVRNYLEEFPLVFPCVHMELEGWRVDVPVFLKEKAAQEKLEADSLKRIQIMLGAPGYNPGSWQQNQKLFQVLGCGDIGKTDRDGVFKQETGEAAMKKAEFRHPLNARIIGDVREYKKSSKLNSTYFDPDKMWKFRNPVTKLAEDKITYTYTDEGYWRLFYRINPSATDTGRFGSSESSFWIGFQIQNVKRGPTVKQYLISDDGWDLGEPDFEQSESRCTFYMAGEQKGIDVVESGKDFHCWNAQLFFGFKYEELWDEKLKKCKTPEAKAIRDEPAKRTNHGANYNMTGSSMLDTVGPKVASKMKVLLKLPPSMSLKAVCQHCLDTWEKVYPGVKGLFYEKILKEVELTKKLVSPLNWTRHFFGDARNNRHHFNSMVAHGPQNLSVAIINRCLFKLWYASIYGILRNVLRIKAQIHDSIPFQYRRGPEFAWVIDEVRKIMTYPVDVKGADGKTRRMVIPVGMSYGKNRWSELK